jgi:hypothetical protein
MKRSSLLICLLLALPGLLFAQRTATQTAKPVFYTLVVQTQPANASVSVDGALLKGNAAPNLAAGQHSVLVRAPGYLDYNAVVTLTGNMNISVSLQPAAFQLSVNAANVKGAQVLINGNPAGQTPFGAQLAPGSYTVTIRAPGFVDYNQNVVMNGPVQVNASLQPLSYQLNVNTGALRGAQVILNGSVVGQTPYSASLQPGGYSLTLRLPGYGDYSVQLNMNGPQTVSAVLQPLAATWQLSLPDSSVNKDMRGGHWSQIQVYIDGAPVKGNQGQFFPGRHTIRVVSGGMAAETFVDAQSGQVYTIEPMIGISVH